MTKIKFCGLSRFEDIESVNRLKPEYAGFVLAPKSRRYVSPEQAGRLKRFLHPDILAVGVFVDEEPEAAADLLNRGIIDIAQLHGNENEDYIKRLRKLSDRPLIKAFLIENDSDVKCACRCTADYILLDSGGGTGTVFNWELIRDIKRPYFLAGGLTAENVRSAVGKLHPFAVDVSSGIETGGRKDGIKMAAFAAAVRKEERL